VWIWSISACTFSALRRRRCSIPLAWFSATRPFSGMFSGGWLVDPYQFDQQAAEQAFANVCRVHPAFYRDHKDLAEDAELVSGVTAASPFPFEDRCADLLERFCRVCDVAVALLRERVEAWEAARKPMSRIVIPPIAFTYDDDDDRPKSDAEAAALTRRQSGETLMDGLTPAGRRRWEGTPRGTLLPNVGPHGSIERAIWGGTGDDYRLALTADDPIVCLVKRRAKLQRWFAPPPAGISYRHAFPVSAIRRLYNGAALANRHALVLNVRVGVSWFNVPGCVPADCKHYFERFKKNLVQWFSDNGLAAPYPAYVFVYERAVRAGNDRFHTHMMLAVPETLRDPFTSYVDKALLRVLKRDELPKGVRWVRWRKVPIPSPERQVPITRDQWIGLTYMLKGADPGVELGLNVHGKTVTVGGITEWDYEDPGQPFAGVPWGTSETLAPGSQQAFRDPVGERFHSLLDWQIANGALDWRELYTDHYLDQAAGRRGPQPPTVPTPSRSRHHCCPRRQLRRKWLRCLTGTRSGRR
jgi:hypothetical protein